MRTVAFPSTAFNAIPVTGTNVYVSEVIDSQYITAFSAQILSTGTSAGTMLLQGSNLPPPNGELTSNYQPANWGSIGTALAISANTQTMSVYYQIYYRYLRLLYTNSSGTGTITANINMQGAE